MAFEKRDNTGAIFKNKNPKSEKSPPLTGNMMVNGVEYWVSAWSKNDKNGEKWISVALTPKNPSPAQTQRAQEPVTVDLGEDSIPF